MQVDLNHVRYWMNAIRDEITDEVRILDGFWSGQLNSKGWLAENLVRFLPADKKVTIDIHGGWLGVLASILFQSGAKVNYIRSVDVDPSCHEIAEKMNYLEMQQGRFESKFGNILDVPLIPNTDVYINTITEHLSQDDYIKWLQRIPENALVVLQGNNFKEAEDHVRCADNLERFKEMCFVEILWEGELECHSYTRYMIIGKNTRIREATRFFEVKEISLMKTKNFSGFKLNGKNRNLPIVSEDIKTGRYWEWASDANSDGLYTITKNKTFYCDDFGHIDLLTKSDGTTFIDFEVNNVLYNQGIADDIVQYAKPLMYSYVEGGYYFSSYVSPKGSIGIPFMLEYFNSDGELEEGYYKGFVDQVTHIYATLKNKNQPFPAAGVSILRNRLKAENVYYFHSLTDYHLDQQFSISTTFAEWEKTLDMFVSDKNMRDRLATYARVKWTL